MAIKPSNQQAANNQSVRMECGSFRVDCEKERGGG
ncbi:unnamed protein product [Onchocerca flexuosa]|uniref:Anacyclamide/piricyclamide family prenylated cyclic peptide n=1 Tax=Onchocerca flexuosa TaxID=387005 RepID=A0A183HTM5_9BILA|nr:unnamed protein product [Onchocerca flexuosa]